MPRTRCWTDQQLIEAVERSHTLAEVCRRIGLRPGKYDTLRAHIKRLGLDASHIPLSSRGFPRGAADVPKSRRWSDDELRGIVAEETSIAGVLRRLDYTTSGGMYRYIVAHIRRLGINTDHFTGQSWANGLSFPDRGSIPLAQVLVKGSTYKSAALRKRLIAAGLKPSHCERCGLSEWNGEPLTLQLDHINGDHTDNRLENLCILCPNCHSQTDTWCGRSRSKPA